MKGIIKKIRNSRDTKSDISSKLKPFSDLMRGEESTENIDKIENEEIEKLAAKITEVEYKNMGVEDDYDVKLPIDEDLQSIEKGIKSSSSEEIDNKIGRVEDRFEEMEILLSKQPETLDLKDIFQSTSSLDEAKNEIRAEIKTVMQKSKQTIDNLKELGFKPEELQTQRRKTLKQIKQRELIQLINSLLEFEEILTKYVEKGKKKLFPRIEDLESRAENFDSKINRIGEIKKRVSNLKQNFAQCAFDKVFTECNEIEDELEDIKAKQENFENKLTNIKSELQELEEGGMDVGIYWGRVKEIEESEANYTKKIQGLNDIFEDLDSKRNRAKRIIGEINQITKTKPFLEKVVDQIDLISKLDNSRKQGNLDYILERGSIHLDKLEDIRSTYNEVKELLSKDRRLLREVEKAGVSLDTFQSEINILEEELQISTFFEKMQLSEEDYYSKLNDKLDDYYGNLSSIESELEGLLEERREEAFKEYEELQEFIDQKEQELEASLEEIEVNKEEITTCLDNKQYEKAIEKCHDLQSSIQTKIKLEEWYEQLEPLIGKVDDVIEVKSIERLYSLVKQSKVSEEELKEGRAIKNGFQKRVDQKKEELNAQLIEAADERKRLTEKGVPSQELPLIDFSSLKYEILEDELNKVDQKLKPIRDKLSQARSKYDSLQAEIKGLKQKIEEKEKYGIDVDKFKRKIPQIEEVEGFEEAFDEISRLEEKLEKQCQEKIKETKKELEEFETLKDDFKEKDIIITPLEKHHDKITQAIEDGELITANSLLEKGIEKSRSLEKEHNKLLSRIKKIKEDLRVLESLEIDTKTLSRRVNTVQEMDDYDAALKECDEIRSSIQAKFEKKKEELTKEITQTISKLDDHEKNGIYVDDLRDRLYEGDDRLSDGSYIEAKKRIEETVRDIDIRLDNYKRLQERVEAVENSVGKAERLDLEVEDIKSQLNKIKSSTDYKAALDEVETLASDVLDKLDQYRERLEANIREARSKFDSYEDRDIVLKESWCELDQAEKKLEEDKIEEATHIYYEALDSAEETIKRYEELISELDGIENDIRRARKLDIETTDLQHSYAEIKKLNDYDKALECCDELHSMINSKFEEKKHELKNNITETVTELEEYEEQDIFIDDLRDSLYEGDNKLSKDSYLEADRIINQTIGAIQSRIENYDQLQQRIESVENTLDTSEELDLEVEENKSKLQEIKDSNDYEWALEEIETLASDVWGKVEKYEQKLKANIEKARSKFHSYEDKGIVLKESWDQLDNSEHKLQEDKVEEATNLYYRALDIAKKTVKQYKHLISELETIDERIQKAAELGIDITVLKNQKDDIKKLEEYDKALERCDELHSTIDSKFEEKKHELKNNITETVTELDEYEDIGIFIDDLKERLYEADDKLSNESYIEANKIIDETFEDIGVRVENYDKLQGRIESVENTLDVSEELDLEIEENQSRLQEIKDSNDYEWALEEIDTLASDVWEKIEKYEQKLEANIDEARGEFTSYEDEGIVLKASWDQLDNAEHKLQEDKVEEATSLYYQALDSAEETVKRYEEVRVELETIEENIDRARKLDIETTKMEDLCAEVKKLDDYDKALERCDELHSTIDSKFEQKKIELKDKIVDVKTKLEELEEQGIYIEDIKNLLYDADDLLSDNSYLDARQKIDEVLVNIEERVENYERLQQRVDTVENTLKKVKKVDLDIQKAKEKLGLGIRDIKDELQDIKESDRYESALEDIDALASDLWIMIEYHKQQLEQKYAETKECFEEYEEEGIVLGKCWDQIESGEDLLKNNNIVIAQNKLKGAKELASFIREKHEDIQQKTKKLEERISDIKNVRCPQCDKTDTIDKAFCENCGTKFIQEIDEQRCDSCEILNPSDVEHCENCEEPLDHRDKIENIGKDVKELETKFDDIKAQQIQNTQDYEPKLNGLNSISEEVDGIENDLEGFLKVRIKELGTKVDSYIEMGCYFPSFEDRNIEILEKLENKEYSKGIEFYNELYIDTLEKIENFDKATDLSNELDEATRRCNKIGVEIEDITAERKRLKNYVDYTKAIEDYRTLLNKIKEREDEYIKSIEKDYVDLKSEIEHLNEKKRFTPERALDRVKEISERLEKEEYRKAKESIKEGKKEKDHFLNKSKEIESNIEEIEKRLSKLKQGGIEIDDLLERALALSEKKELDKVLEQSRELIEESKELKGEYEETAAEEISEADDLIERDLARGLNMEYPQEILTRASKALEEDKYKKSIDLAQECKTVIKDIEEEYDQAMQALDTAREEIQEAQRKDIVVLQYERKLDQISSMDDYSELEKKAKEIKFDIEKKINQKEKEVNQQISEVEGYYEELENQDINIQSIKIFLEEAKAKKEEGRLSEALKKAQTAYRRGKKLQQNYKEAENLLSETKEKIKICSQGGVNVGDLEDQIRELEAEGNYSQLVEKCRDIQDEIDSRERKIKDDISARINRIEDRTNRLENKGVNLKKVKERLEEAREEFEKRDYETSEIFLDKTESLIDETKRQFDELVNQIESGKLKLKEAKKAGLNIDVEEKSREFEELKSHPNYQQALFTLNEIIEDITKRISEAETELEDKIDKLGEGVSDLKEIGSRTGITVDISELEAAKGYYNKREVGKGLKEVDTGLTKYDTLKRDFGRLEQNLEFLEELKDKLEETNRQTSDIKKDIQGIKSDILPSSQIGKKIISCDELIDKYRSIATDILLDKVDELTTEIEILKQKNVKCGDLYDRSNKLKGLVKAGEVKEAFQKVGKIKSEIEEKKEKQDRFLERYSEIKNYLTDIEKLNAEVDEPHKILKKAESAPTYEEGFEIIDRVEEIADKKLDEFFEEKRTYLDNTLEILYEIEKEDFESVSSSEIESLKDHVTNTKQLVSEEKGDKVLEETRDIDHEFERIKESAIDELEEKLKEIPEGDIEDKEGYIKKLDLYQSILQDIEEGKIAGVSQRIRKLKEKEEEIRKKFEKKNQLLEDIQSLEKELEDWGADLNKQQYPDDVGVEEIKNNDYLEESIKEGNNLIDHLEDVKKDWIDEKSDLFDELQMRINELSEDYMDSRMDELVSSINVSFEADNYSEIKTPLENLRQKVNEREEAQLKDRKRMRLPFHHGMETELQVITNEGKWIDGKKMSKIFSRFLDEAESLILERLRDDAPEYLQEKAWAVKIEEDKAGNQAIHVKYEVDGECDWFSIIGKDSHVSVTTNILEIQTPPCAYLKEFEWWINTVFEVSYRSIKKLGTGLLLVSTGMNPIEGFSKGVTFGDHHHIGIEDEEVRFHAYNLLRNYIPHLIAMTVNSPLKDGETPEIKHNENDSILSPLNSLSLRIENNIGQLSAPPVLDFEDDDKQDFLDKIGRNESSARMVDLYPFTRFNTIEVRITDTQMAISDRIGVAVLLQAIVKKARDLVDKGEDLPKPISKRNLLQLRENAYKNGLLAPFLPQGNAEKYTLKKCYPTLDKVRDKNDVRYMKDSCAEMLRWLSDQFTEMGVIRTNYLDPLLIKVFGPKKSAEIGPPLTSSQFQLYLLEREARSEPETLLNLLDDISSRSAEYSMYNPIIERFGPPDVPDELKPVGLSLDVLSTDIVPTKDDQIKVKGYFNIENPSDKTFREVDLRCKIIDDEDTISKEKFHFRSIDSKEEKEIEFEKSGLDRESIPKLSIELYEGGNLSSEQTYPLSVQEEVDLSLSYTGSTVMNTPEETLDVTFSTQIENLRDKELKGSLKIMAEDEKGEVKGELEMPIDIEERKTFASINDLTSDWAINALEKQDYEKIEPLTINIDTEKGEENLHLKGILSLEDRPNLTKKTDDFKILPK